MRAPLFIVLAAALGGCASVPREAGFPDVAKLASERTGSRVHWNQGTAEDRAVAAHVRALLGATLTAESAVEIALLNNRRLQATYEELSLAQADLVQAGLLRNPSIHGEIRLPTDGSGGSGIEFGIARSFVDLFQIPLRKRVAGAAFEAAKLRVAGAILDHAAETRAAFFAVEAAEQLREIRETALAATS
jgi:outer membrane protein, heavy metal efflux system